ncbi:MAG: hypothetical protein FWF81_01690 [Defluviitaleaceae bacterium]|nr:hypothetical protein [Defluviitaleaceae bacterium]
MKKNVCVFMCAIFFITFFAGCAADFENLSPPPEQGESVNIIPVFEYFSEDTALAISRFSQNLFREILTSDEINVIVSPVSAYYVLSMVSLGTENNTLHEFESVLGGEARGIARELSALTHSLTSAGSGTIINMAGSVWISDDFTVNTDFDRAMTTYFHAPAHLRDLSEPSVVDEINDWIYEQTQGLVSNTLEEPEPEAVMMLINTLYFSARWARSFNPMTQLPGVFYPETGEPIETIFLHTTHIPLSVSIADYYEAVFLPYAGGRLGFFIVRPTTGISIRDFVASHDLSEIYNRTEKHSEVLVSMPALDVEYRSRMNDYLKMMGLELAFDADLSELSGITDDISERIYLSEVLQQIRFKVHSEGTEAAAVTVGLPAARGGLSQPIELNFNTPYVFMVYDTYTNVPLFMGVTDKPF